MINAFENPKELMSPEFMNPEWVESLMKGLDYATTMLDDTLKDKRDEIRTFANKIYSKEQINNLKQNSAKTIENIDLVLSYMREHQLSTYRLKYFINNYFKTSCDLNVLKDNMDLELTDLFLIDSKKTERKPKKIKKSNKTKTPNIVKIEEKKDVIIKKTEKVLVEIECEKLVLKDLDKIKSIFKNEKLKNIEGESLKVIQKMNLLIEENLMGCFKNENLSETEWLVLKRMTSNLFLMSCDLNSYITAMLSNDFESLPDVFTYFLSMSLVFEQLMQKESVAQNGEMYQLGHRLTDLMKATNSGEKFGKNFKEFAKEFDHGILLTRYTQEIERRLLEKEIEKPKLLTHLLESLKITEKAQKKPIKLDENMIKSLKDLSQYLFECTKTTYEHLFAYLQNKEGKELEEGTIKAWMEFLDTAETHILSHLDQQKGKEIKGKEVFLFNRL